MLSTLLVAVQSTVPPTTSWGFSTALVMIIANVIAVVIGRFAIQKPGKGPDLPTPPGLWGNFGVPELLATMSFGHILGAGAILGLSNAGVL